MFAEKIIFTVTPQALNKAKAALAQAQETLEQGKRERLNALVSILRDPSEFHKPLYEHTLCYVCDIPTRTFRNFLRFHATNIKTGYKVKDIPVELPQGITIQGEIYTGRLFDYPYHRDTNKYVGPFDYRWLAPNKADVMIVPCMYSVTYYGTDFAGMKDRARQLVRMEKENIIIPM